MGVLGIDSNKVKQSTIQQQVGVESGVGYGGLSNISKSAGVFGGGAAGNVSLAAGTGVVRGSGTSSINILTNDPSTAIAALQSNQQLSTLAISYANTNSLAALETLRALQGGAIVAASPGSDAATVGAALTGGTIAQQSQTQETIKSGLLGLAVLIGLGLLLYNARKT